MDRIVIAPESTAKQVAAFKAALLCTKHKGTIVYHTGPHCMGSPLRRWAMGAYEAGLVVLVKERVPGGFDHCAIRTAKKHRDFSPAAEN